MLEELKNINWSELQTSFSDSATDVPKYIALLTDESEDVRYTAEERLRALVTNTYMYGTVTPRVIPFLLEILASDAVKHKCAGAQCPVRHGGG